MTSLSLSASALAPSVRSGRVTLKDYYEGVARRFETVKFLGVFDAQGTAPATLAGPSVEAPPPRGALAGVPFVATPDFDVAGAPTHAGNAALACALAEADAPSVAALRARGAHFLGHTTGSDLSLAVAGSALAKNPFTQFGLSGGSAAAAVAARVATVGLVVDVTGSARAAAALTGCVAFRPSHGRYTRGGTLSVSPTLGTVALVGRTVRDLQLLDAVLGSATAEAMLASSAASEAAGGGSAAAAADAAEAGAGGEDAAAAAPQDAREEAALKMQSLARGFNSRRRVKNAKETGDISLLPGSEARHAPRPAAAAGAAAAAAAAATPTKASARFQSQLQLTEARLESLQEGEGASSGGGGGAGEMPPTASLEASAGAGGGPGSPSSAHPLLPRGVFSAELEGLRIGVPRSSALWQRISPALLPVVEAALSRLAKAGAVLVDVELEGEGSGSSGGSGGSDGNLAAAAAECARLLLAYEAPREIGAYALCRSAPVPAPPKKALAEGEEEAEAEAEAPAEEGAAPSAPAPLVPLDTLVAPSAVLRAYKGPQHLAHLLAAQVNYRTAVSATQYRGALVYQRPAIKRGFTQLFKRHQLAALVYPATPLAAAPTKGAEGLQVEFLGETMVRVAGGGGGGGGVPVLPAAACRDAGFPFASCVVTPLSFSLSLSLSLSLSHALARTHVCTPPHTTHPAGRHAGLHCQPGHVCRGGAAVRGGALRPHQAPRGGARGHARRRAPARGARVHGHAREGRKAAGAGSRLSAPGAPAGRPHCGGSLQDGRGEGHGVKAWGGGGGRWASKGKGRGERGRSRVFCFQYQGNEKRGRCAWQGLMRGGLGISRGAVLGLQLAGLARGALRGEQDQERVVGSECRNGWAPAPPGGGGGGLPASASKSSGLASPSLPCSCSSLARL
jgi:Asp-tRNA(Asn)/Glu-tRNA(Gln) amidotransferase A subunit family amidase